MLWGTLVVLLVYSLRFPNFQLFYSLKMFLVKSSQPHAIVNSNACNKNIFYLKVLMHQLQIFPYISGYFITSKIKGYDIHFTKKHLQIILLMTFCLCAKK